MRQQSLVSVIVLNLEGEDVLPDALSTLADQSYQPIEILAVDNGSRDGSREIAARYPVTWVPFPPMSGPPRETTSARVLRTVSSSCSSTTTCGSPRISSGNWSYLCSTTPAVRHRREAMGLGGTSGTSSRYATPSRLLLRVVTRTWLTTPTRDRAGLDDWSRQRFPGMCGKHGGSARPIS